MKELTLGEFAHVLNYLIDNNHRLIDSGDTSIAVCLEGEAGLGKTAVVEQVAKNKGMTFAKINLAQLEEPADLTGFPIKEYKIIRNGQEEWVSADLLRTMDCDYATTADSRMGYAIPAWVPRDENPNGVMLVLDDFSRANSLIMKAIMELVNKGEYVSWKLPKYTNIVLTSNPDNGVYSVSSMDSAQKSRLITFSGKFDIQEWARWAEMFGLDGRAINFAILYHTEIFEPKNNVVLANARSYTTFCRAISGMPNWGASESLSMILEIASGCFFGEDNILGGLFTQFINNHLDRLISPDRLINGAWDTVKGEVENCVYQNGRYRADIANILATRFMNYADKNLGTDKAESQKVCDRINDFITSDTMLFNQDILYNVVKTLCRNHVQQTNRWFLNKEIRSIAL
jgi:hypothetical protein